MTISLFSSILLIAGLKPLGDYEKDECLSVMKGDVIMATTKKAAAKAAEAQSEVLETVVDAPKAEEVEAEAKAPAKKTVKKVAKETVKKSTRTTKAAKAEEKVEEAADEKPAAKKAELTATISVQFAGKSYTNEELVKIAKDVWQYDLKKEEKDLQNVELYVKPEESTVYYVFNGTEEGCFGI